MSVGAALAIRAWLARGAPAERRFRAALADPAEAQRARLAALLRAHARSAFGDAHGFAAIRDARDYARRVPVQRWDDVAPWVARLRAGEPDVLACGAVTHLAPTGGSTGARKLVPFGPALQRAVDAAVAPWVRDLARTAPALRDGPHWWAVTPLADDAAAREPGAVPIGFDDDATHLGGVAAALVRRAFAVPPGLERVREHEHWRALLLLALLRVRALRLVSIWHPSLLGVVTDAAPALWPVLLDAVAHGTLPWRDALPAPVRRAWRARPDRPRAAELRAIGPHDWPRWWPGLAVVSCWGEQAAAAGWRRLAARLPHVHVQPKGLLATEGVVTIPYAGTTPLALTSHVFEFVGDDGAPRLAHELEPGRAYEVLLTNGAGLWRYALGDVVECTGRLAATPTLRFAGRAGRGSDLRGEKLAEPFVADVLARAGARHAPHAALALHAADDGVRAGYRLVVEGPCDDAAALATAVDRALGENPHWALARRLGQLAPLVVERRDDGAARDALLARPGRLGDRKPPVLVPARAAPPA